MSTRDRYSSLLPPVIMTCAAYIAAAESWFLALVPNVGFSFGPWNGVAIGQILALMAAACVTWLAQYCGRKGAKILLALEFVVVGFTAVSASTAFVAVLAITVAALILATVPLVSSRFFEGFLQFKE